MLYIGVLNVEFGSIQNNNVFKNFFHVYKVLFEQILVTNNEINIEQ